MGDNQDKSLDLTGVKPIADAANEATTRTLDAAEGFLSRICLPAAEEFGLLLRDRVSYWRTINAAKLAQKAAAKLGEQPDADKKHAHPRIVSQIIEQGSWIEQDDIQDIWAGLLASSCTLDGKDDTNLTFVDLLSRLTASQVRVLNYMCQAARKEVASGGWLTATPLHTEIDKIQEVAGISDIYRLDLELDHLRSLGLMDINSGFEVHSQNAILHPSNLALQMYSRCHGHSGNPVEFYGLTATEERRVQDD